MIRGRERRERRESRRGERVGERTERAGERREKLGPTLKNLSLRIRFQTKVSRELSLKKALVWEMNPFFIPILHPLQSYQVVHVQFGWTNFWIIIIHQLGFCSVSFFSFSLFSSFNFKWRNYEPWGYYESNVMWNLMRLQLSYLLVLNVLECVL